MFSKSHDSSDIMRIKCDYGRKSVAQVSYIKRGDSIPVGDEGDQNVPGQDNKPCQQETTRMGDSNRSLHKLILLHSPFQHTYIVSKEKKNEVRSVIFGITGSVVMFC